MDLQAMKNALKNAEHCGKDFFYTDQPTTEEVQLAELPQLNPFLAAQLISFAYRESLEFESLLAKCQSKEVLAAACHGISPSIVEGVCSALKQQQEHVVCRAMPEMLEGAEAEEHNGFAFPTSIREASFPLQQAGLVDAEQLLQDRSTCPTPQDQGPHRSVGMTGDAIGIHSEVVTLASEHRLLDKTEFVLSERLRLADPVAIASEHVQWESSLHQGQPQSRLEGNSAARARAAQPYMHRSQEHKVAEALEDSAQGASPQRLSLLLKTARVHKDPRLLPPGVGRASKKRKICSPEGLAAPVGSLQPAQEQNAQAMRPAVGSLQHKLALVTPPTGHDGDMLSDDDPEKWLEELSTHLHAFSPTTAHEQRLRAGPTPRRVHIRNAHPAMMAPPSSQTLQDALLAHSSSDEDLAGLLHGQGAASTMRPQRRSLMAHATPTEVCCMHFSCKVHEQPEVWLSVFGLLPTWHHHYHSLLRFWQPA